MCQYSRVHRKAWVLQSIVSKRVRQDRTTTHLRTCGPEASYFIFQFSCSVLFDSFQPHELQHARLPCSSTTPGACSHSCPSSPWCPPTISSSVVISFSSCLQSFPASGSLSMSQLFAPGGQSIGASVLFFLINIQVWFPLGLTGLILQFKGLSRVFFNTFKSISSSALSLLYGPTLTSTHDYWKDHSFDYMDFCWQSNVSAF